MTTSESKGRFFLQNESIRIDSHKESNRFESRIGMLYRAAAAPGSATPELDSTHMNGLTDDKKRSVVPTAQSMMSLCVCVWAMLPHSNKMMMMIGRRFLYLGRLSLPPSVGRQKSISLRAE